VPEPIQAIVDEQQAQSAFACTARIARFTTWSSRRNSSHHRTSCLAAGIVAHVEPAAAGLQSSAVINSDEQPSFRRSHHDVPGMGSRKLTRDAKTIAKKAHV
jgi:hypothetical protein